MSRKPVLLSERQYDVLACLHEGLTNKGIARRLGLTPRMVLTETQCIYRRMRVVGDGQHSRVQAALAFERGEVAMVRASVPDIALPSKSAEAVQRE